MHGDGWAAGWTSFQHPTHAWDQPGPVTLRGGLSGEFGCQALGWVRGRITRLWTIHARHDVPLDPDVMSSWYPAWGSTQLTAVTEQPVLQPGHCWPDLAPGVVQDGLLAELDLDALPDEHTGGLIRR